MEPPLATMALPTTGMPMIPNLYSKFNTYVHFNTHVPHIGVQKHQMFPAMKNANQSKKNVPNLPTKRNKYAYKHIWHLWRKLTSHITTTTAFLGEAVCSCWNSLCFFSHQLTCLLVVTRHHLAAVTLYFLLFCLIFDQCFWPGFGQVWGRFWEGFGKVFGRCLVGVLKEKQRKQQQQ